MKKILSLLLSLTMVLSFMSGCKDENKGSSLYNPDEKIGEDLGGLKMPITNSDEKVTWFVTSSQTGLNDSYVVKKIRAVTGMNLELIAASPASSTDKTHTLIASGEIPDILGGLDDKRANDLALQGAFAAVEDYIDVLPNFKRIFVDNKENDWIFKSYAATDGKLYGFYGWDWQRDVNTGAMMYRKDIFDKHGIKMWNSPETFVDALRQLKKLYPNSTPFTSKSKEEIVNSFAKQWQMRGKEPYYDEKDKIWKFTNTDPQFKDILDMFKLMYKEGLVDPEFLTNTQPAWTAKMTAKDKAFVTCDWIGRMPMFKEQTAESVPGYDLRFANPVGPYQTIEPNTQLCWAKYVAKHKDDKRDEECFKLLDFCVSPAGRELISMGVEGETYTLDENGMAIMKGFEDEPNVGGDKLEEKWGMRVEGMYLGFDRRCSYFNLSKEEQEPQDYVKDPKHVEVHDPILAFTPEEKEEINKYIVDVQKACNEFTVKYILGDESWDAWVKKAKDLGAEKIVAIYNEAQKRYDAE